MSYGIDTIKVGYRVASSDLDLTGWSHTLRSLVRENSEDVYREIYQKSVTSSQGANISMKFIPTDYRSNPFSMLLLEFSLPKLVIGCNHRDINDMDRAFRTANSAIATIPGLPPLPPIQDAALYRVDVCANLHVGEDNVSDYILALQKGSYPRRKAKPYHKSGVMFVSSEISTCIYDKFLESGNEEARGILRYEISMRKRREIMEWAGNSEPTLNDITKGLIRDVLIKDMKRLSLNNHMVCDRLNAQAILKAKYSRTRVQSLLGYLEVRRTMTVDQMKQDGYTAPSIRHNEKLLAKVGISSLSTGGNKTLPALTILLEEAETEQNTSQSPSDTRTSELDTLRQEDPQNTPMMSDGRLVPRASRWQVRRSSIRPMGRGP